MKRILVIACLAVAAAAGSAHAVEPVQVKFAIPIPPQAGIASHILLPWSEALTKESKGTMVVQNFPGPGVANLGNAYDRLTNGVIDITWGIFGPISSQFPKTTVVSLPFETRNGTEATLGLWGVYADGAIADEYSKVKLLAFAVFPGTYPHFKKPVRTLADLQGLKISTDGRVTSRVLQELGASPVAMPISETYQSAQRGTIDGIGTAWPALLAFKLFEIVNYHLEVPIGNDPAFVAMNRASYEKLPAAARAAIDGLSGKSFTQKLLDEIGHEIEGARGFVAKQPGHVIASLDPAEEARWAEKVKPAVEDWARSTPDGAHVLAAFREEVKKVRAAH